MTAAAEAVNALVPDGPEPPDSDLVRNVRPGPSDTLIIDGAGMAGLPLLGTIVAVCGDDAASVAGCDAERRRAEHAPAAAVVTGARPP